MRLPPLLLRRLKPDDDALSLGMRPPSCETLPAAMREMARINEVLRGGLERFLEAPTIEAVLDALVVETIRVAGAAGAAVLRYTGQGTGFEFVTVAQGTTFTHATEAAEFVRSFRQVSSADPVGFFARLLAGEFIALTSDELGTWFPVAADYHRKTGNVMIWNLPFGVQGKISGYLGLALTRVVEPDRAMLETLEALALQACVALELQEKTENAMQLARAREREQAAEARAASLARTNEVLGTSLGNLVSFTDQRAFLREVFGRCARQCDARGGALFFHDPATDSLHKQLGWIRGVVVDFTADPASDHWHEPLPVAVIPDWTEAVQLDPREERVWARARPWHRSQGYAWLCRVPLKAGATALGFMGLAFGCREDVTPEKLETLCAMSHQIALAVQLDRLATEARQVAVLGERNRIARDLHDVLAQGFVGVLTQIGVLEGALELGDFDEMSRSMERARQIARQGLEEARRSVHALRPSRHGDDELFIRLQDILAGLTPGTGLTLHTVQTGRVTVLGEDADWAAVKFVQQALTNTLRYADAENFHLVLDWTPTALQIAAIDDGVGFDPDAPRQGIGLRVMHERAEECGGDFTVQSRIGLGTTLRLTLPLGPNA